MVTADDLAGAPAGTAVADLARDTPVLGPDDPLERSGVLDGELAVVPVVEGGRVVGLARAADAVRLLQRLLRASARSAGGTRA